MYWIDSAMELIYEIKLMLSGMGGVHELLVLNGCDCGESECLKS